jgi:hypothetical protein
MNSDTVFTGYALTTNMTFSYETDTEQSYFTKKAYLKKVNLSKVKLWIYDFSKADNKQKSYGEDPSLDSRRRRGSENHEAIY